MDINGIIHDCSRPEYDNPHFQITEEKIFSDTMYYIDFLFRMVKPKKVFFMAVDGVAPRAKMNQQRARRFRSARKAQTLEQRAQANGEVLHRETRFDRNSITSGTPFMVRLQKQLQYFVVNKTSTDPLWQGLRVYLSGHETPGEGEHKIMDFIRAERAKVDYDPNTRHCLFPIHYELVMLGLAAHEPRFSLLKADIRFGNKRLHTPEETTFHLLHLSLLREYLDIEFSALKDDLHSFKYDLENIIDDWVLMGFLVGNDYIPHLPNLLVNHDALPLLWQTYIDVLPSCGGYINNAGHLNLEIFETYLTALSKFDFEQFSEEAEDLNLVKKAETSAQKAKHLPAARRLDILDEQFRQHKLNYYMTKLDYKKVTPETLRDQAEGYVRGIQWILLYYYEGVPSWSWFYPHHYAPYMSDVKGFKNVNLKFDLGTPLLPFEQLMAVLPAASKELLPEPYQSLMISDSSPVIDFYPWEFETDLNGKQLDREAVVLIPFIDEIRLLSAIRSVQHLLTNEETFRNQHGPHLLYEYTEKPGEDHPKLTKLRMDEFRIPPSLLRKGILPGTKLDVFFPGFSTLKHIPHRAKLSKEGVRVVQTGSSGDNIILYIKQDKKKPDIEQIAREYLNKEIYVGWPHLFEAKVVAVCNHGFSISVQEPEDGKNKHINQNLQIRRDRYDGHMATVWQKEVTAIAERYKERRGIVIGDTHILLRALPVTGRKYIFSSHGRVTMDKQFGTLSMPFALQTTVKDIAVHDQGFCQFRTLQDFFPAGTSVFMLGWQYYGCQGEVIKTDMESGTVRINLTIFEEPELGAIMNDESMHAERYFNGHTIANSVGISSYILSRLTGTIYVVAGSAKLAIEQANPRRVNVGLNLKFTKRGEEVPGYTKYVQSQWQYSQKTIDVLRLYKAKFPEMVEVLSKTCGKQNPENLYESEVIPIHCEYTLKDVEAFIQSLPCATIQSIKTGTDNMYIKDTAIQVLEKQIKHFMFIQENRRPKRMIMQEKPDLLFKPLPTSGSLIPDPTTTYELYDRVVNTRQGFSVPFGLRGTVVGIRPAEMEVNTLYEVIFDEDFQGGISIRNSSKSGYKMPPSSLLNLSHGRRIYEEKSANQSQSQKDTRYQNYQCQTTTQRTSVFSYAQAARQGTNEFQRRNNGGYQDYRTGTNK